MKISISGGLELSGSIIIPGAKNLSLPLLAATYLTECCVTLTNTPNIADFFEVISIIKENGSAVSYLPKRSVKICSKNASSCLSKSRTRTVFLFLGSLLGRFGNCRVPLPEGDKIGDRRTNFHLESLEQMGANFEQKDGYIIGSVSGNSLKGIDYTMKYPSVGATQQLMMAASMAEGLTIINNASIEPETKELGEFLRKIGVDIKLSNQRIEIIGSAGKLYNSGDVTFEIMCDRLQAMTYLLAAIVTNGDITIIGPKLFTMFGDALQVLCDIGGKLECGHNYIRCQNILHTPNDYEVKTGVFPEFQTDFHPIFATAFCLKTITSKIYESVFDDRFAYIQELSKMGGQFIKEGRVLNIQGIKHFTPSYHLLCHDIRAGAAVLLAALNAPGRSIISNYYHIERGYDNLIENLSKLGAKIEILEEKSLY